MANVPIKAGMKDRIDSNVARDGSTKKPQTSFATHPGMKSQTAYRGAAPADPKTGPVAGGTASVMSPTVEGKKVQTEFPAKWGMKDADGGSVDHALGRRVLSEAHK